MEYTRSTARRRQFFFKMYASRNMQCYSGVQTSFIYE